LATFAFPQRSIAQIKVTTTAQDNLDPTKCSFREAIYATEFAGAVAISSTDPDTTYSTGCTDDSGNWDTIALQSGATYSFDRFWDGDAHNPFGPTATPIIFKTITIVGNGAILAWTGTGNARLFAVGFASITPTAGVVTGTTYSGTGNLTLQHVYVKDFHVKGGDGGIGGQGAGGGGGGLGAGGAIFVGQIPGGGVAGLTIENSTFENNGAVGGNGGFACCVGSGTAGGGGGGLSGKGGVGDNGGGGGGGSRGNGALGAALGFAGGGGGGTVFDGGPPESDGATGGPGGYLCGGNGGDFNDNGFKGTCAGGGGGGGGLDAGSPPNGGDGGSGNYGGGGGGAGDTSADLTGSKSGGDGGFGGGGGSGSGQTLSGRNGGDGGFGAGGGSGDSKIGSGAGSGGHFGGNADSHFGGGGGAVGGAIFNDSGIVVVQNSTFFNNFVAHGLGGGGNADPGADSGGAIFSRNGSTTIQDVTINGNQATGSGAGIEVMNDGSTTTFVLENTIIAGNNGTMECIVSGSVTTDGSTGNLIVNNGGCPNVAVTSDPMLDSSPNLNTPGDTPTIALLSGSPAIGAGDPSLNTILRTDQRGVPRKDTPDIGAYEAVPIADLSLSKAVSPSTAKAGDTVTYTLTLNNIGPDTANDIAFADFLPTALTFVSCSASGGATCSSQGGFLVVSYSTLAANDPQTITIKGKVNAGADRGTVTNQASVSDASPFDPDTSNNSSSASFIVLVPDFSITAVSPITIAVGGSGTSLATVKSIDTFASAAKLTASGPSGFQESFSANPVTPPSGGSTTSTLTVSLGPSVTAGSYTVHVTGTSGALTHSASVSVNVQTTIAGTANVINTDVGLACIDNSGIGTALTSKLAVAQTALNAGETQVETNTLQATLDQLYAQAGKHIKTACLDGSGLSFNPDAVLVSDVNGLLVNAGANVNANPVTGNVVNANGVGIPGVTVSILNSAKATVATATTDVSGFYYFPADSGLTLGTSYSVRASVPAPYGGSKPFSQEFTWRAVGVSLSNFVLN
jgi:uncharacterized repeat protein (TIGR01451 family)